MSGTATIGATPQYVTALERANEVRLGRAALHRSVDALPADAGRRRLAELLEAHHEHLAGAQLGKVLKWPQRCGRKWMLKRCAALGVFETKLVGELTDRQTAELARALRDGR